MQPAPTPPPPPAARSRRPALVIGGLVLLAAVFLGGFVPQKLRADRLEETLRVTQLDLELARLHRILGIATLEAQRNNFASAARATTVFFDGCQRLTGDAGLAKEPRTRIALGAYANSRDEFAVQLAQADPQVAQRLASLYFTMEGVLSRRQ